jgi:diacylglycerol kinase (ATP)
MRITVLHNPSAGEGDVSEARLLDALRRAGHQASYHITGEDDIARVLQDPGDAVVVAGGDGTVEAAAAHLVGRGIPIGLIPVGTANNIATSLGVRGTPEALVQGWAGGRTVPVDVGVLRSAGKDRVFFESAGFGFFPRQVELFRSTKPEGMDPEAEVDLARSFWLRDLDSAPLIDASLTLDGEPVEGPFLLVEAMNVPRLGPRLALAPRARPGDGWFDVVLVGDADRDRLRAYLAGLLEGAAPEADLPVRRARHLVVRTSDRYFHRDDEMWSPAGSGVNEVWMELNTGGLAFLVAGVEDERAAAAR